MQPSSRVNLAAEPKESLEVTLMGAYAELMKGIGPISDSSVIVSHPAYKRIVAMGKVAIPIILHDLQREPSLLAWTLFDITGANPVRRSDYGKIDKITKAWLKWGRKNKYIK